METITFYSYKGGVGRSLAVTNIAYYLSRFGFNVCLLDFDLEAPGLHHKFKIDENGKIKEGLVDYIYDFFYNKQKRSIDSLAHAIPTVSKEHGNITLIPAGNPNKKEYLNKLSTIDWDEILYSKKSPGIVFFENMKKEIEVKIKPDFLIIDSRTGITEIGGLSTSILADKIVYFNINNKESFNGSKLIYNNVSATRKILNRPNQQPYFVLSRIPYDENKTNEKIIVKKFKDFFELDTPPFIIHSNRNLEFQEDIIMQALTDSDESVMAEDYLKLFSNVVHADEIRPRLELMINEIYSGILENPDIAQKELEELTRSFPHRITYEKLIDLYKIRNESKKKIVEIFHKSWRKDKNLSKKHFDFYIKLFIEQDLSSWNSVDFNPEIVEHYLKINSIENPAILKKLGAQFFKFNQFDKAEEIFINISKKKEFEEESLIQLFRIYKSTKSNNKGLELIAHNKKIIFSNDRILMQVIEMLIDFNQIEKISEHNSLISEEFKLKFWKQNKTLAFKYFKSVNEEEEYIDLLQNELQIAIRKGKERDIFEIGKTYFQIGRKEYYIAHLKKHGSYRKLIEELEKRYY